MLPNNITMQTWFGESGNEPTPNQQQKFPGLKTELIHLQKTHPHLPEKH